MRFTPHKWTINAFDDGSAVWVLEYRSENSYKEYGWDPKSGFKVYRDTHGHWVDTPVAYRHRSGSDITPAIARSIIRSWKQGKKGA